MTDILNHLTKILQPLCQVTIAPPLAIGLGAVGCMGLVSKANSFLSRRALNSSEGNNTWDWQREIVVVTGGSSGIGAAIVELLAKHGIKTLNFDVAEPHQCFKAENVFFYKVDLTDSEQIKSVAKRVRSEHGDPTVLINNAGTQSNKPILELSESQLHTTFDVNILAHFLLVKEFLPAMVSNNHGHIVAVASLASYMTRAINVDYACTKSAALAFHEGLGQELRHLYHAPGVRTSIVHPGWVKTPLIRKLVDSGVLRGHILEPMEVAEAIVQQILSKTGAQLFLPSNYWIISLIRAAPAWIQELIRNLLSTTRSYARD